MTLPANIIVTTRAGRPVYRLGSVLDGASPQDVGPYQVGNISIPGHGWFQQWTDWSGSPLTIKKTPAQIIVANRSFPFGDTGCKFGAVTNPPFLGPLDNGGVGKYMPATGERPEIGWTTDVVGSWMMGGSPDPMLAWAMAADSIPINYVDMHTGKPINLVDYPSANTYENPGNQGQPWFPRGPNEKPDNSGYYGYSGGWDPDRAHWPSLTFMAFYATGMDLGLLFNLQCASNFITISDAANTGGGKGAVINPAQTRQIAWGLRSMFEAHIATKDAEAAGLDMTNLLPSSVFKTILDQNFAFYGPYKDDPARQIIRTIDNPNKFSPWGYDYLQTALSLGVLTGHSDWVPLYIWLLGNLIARLNNKSGYPPGYGVLYSFEDVRPGDTWGSAYVRAITLPDNALTPDQAAALAADPLNGGVALIGHEYLYTTRAAMVMADYLDKKGLAPVRATYPEFDTCLANAERMFRAYGQVNPRVSVVSDPNAAPIVLPPLPTPEPVPTHNPTNGEINMSAPALNAPFTATVHFLDDSNVDRPVDSVNWFATGAAHMDTPIGNGPTQTGVYAGTGPFEITAIGHVGGNDITAKIGGTVPVPFPTHGEITLS